MAEARPFPHMAKNTWKSPQGDRKLHQQLLSRVLRNSTYTFFHSIWLLTSLIQINSRLHWSRLSRFVLIKLRKKDTFKLLLAWLDCFLDRVPVYGWMPVGQCSQALVFWWASARDLAGLQLIWLRFAEKLHERSSPADLSENKLIKNWRAIKNCRQFIQVTEASPDHRPSRVRERNEMKLTEKDTKYELDNATLPTCPLLENQSWRKNSSWNAKSH